VIVEKRESADVSPHLKLELEGGAISALFWFLHERLVVTGVEWAAVSGHFIAAQLVMSPKSSHIFGH